MTDSDAIARARQRFQREADRLRDQVRAAEDEARRVQRSTEVPAANSADEAAQQVAEIRSRLDDDLAALEARLPPRDLLLAKARWIGGLAVAAIALLAVAGILVRRRRERRAREHDLRIQAAEIARFLPGVSEQAEEHRAG